MDKARNRWWLFVLALGLMLTAALSISLYKSYSAGKQPVSAQSVRC